ncbi:MAG TPA: pitrilysin family protein [Herpetosiphonaceae bacterium]
MAPVKVVLPNGLRIYTDEMPHTHSVSMGIFTRVGSRYEDARLSGISHFLEHMFFKGTERRPTAKEISEAIEGIGGFINASTSFDVTTYYCKVANIHFDRGIDVLTDMLNGSVFDPKEIEKERGVIQEEIKMSLDVPAQWVHQILDELMWGDQPLGRDIAGTLETVGAFTREDLLEYQRHHYTAGNTVVSVAGSVSSDQVVQALTAALAKYPTGGLHKPILTTEIKPGPLVSLINKATEQTNFALGLATFAYTDPDRWALSVLDSILGGGMSSRLFQEIREERGLAYSVGSYNTEYDDAGKWIVYGGVEVGKAHAAIEAVVTELRKLRDNGVTDAELTRIKEQVKGGMLLGLEDTWSVASRNGRHEMRYGEVIPVEQIVAWIEAVSHEDIQRVARRLIRDDNLYLSVIGPHEDEAAFRDLLKL